MAGINTDMTNPFVLAQMDAMTTQTPQTGLIGALENSNMSGGPVPPQNRGFLARMLEDVDYMHRRDAAAQQDQLFNTASQSIAKDMQGGATPEVALANAFKSNPALLAHPDFFQNFDKLHESMRPKLTEHNPENQLVDPSGKIIVNSGEGVPNAGKLTYETGPSGQVYAIAHDMAGKPISVTNQSEAEARENASGAEAAAARSQVPLNAAKGREAEANTQYLEGRSKLFTGLTGMSSDTSNGATPGQPGYVPPITGNDLQRHGLDPSLLQYYPNLAKMNREVLDNPTFNYALNIAQYRQAPPSPYAQARPDSTGTIAMQIVRQINPDYDETNWLAKKGIVEDFSKVGANNAGGRLLRFNAIANHLTLYEPAIQALGNGNIQEFNKWANAYKAQTGKVPPTNVNQIGQIIGQELENAIQGARSGEAERLAAAAHMMNTAKSPGQLEAAAENVKGFLRGQVGSMETQYGRTGLKDFRSQKFMGPELQRLMQGVPEGGGPSISTEPPAPPPGFSIVGP